MAGQELPDGGYLVVVDLDDKDGKCGSAALDALALEPGNGPLPPTFTVTTANGGRHLYFRHREPLTNSRSEEHTSELQSIMRNSYAAFCLKTKKNTTN